MTQSPTKGRVVHFVLANSETRAAEVVNAWPENSFCNLTVKLDQLNDLNLTLDHGLQMMRLPCSRRLIPKGAHDMMNGTLAVRGAPQDEETKAPGTWHWPPRV